MPGGVPSGHHLALTSALDVGVEDDREGVDVLGRHLPRVDWTRIRLRGCLIRLVDVAEVVLDQARLIDSTLNEPDVLTLSSADSTWRSVVVEGGRIGAWDLAGGVWDTVRVVGAQLGYVSLRDASLTDVELRDCRIQTLDLAQSTARRVRLHGCVVDELVLRRAELEDVDLRGAHLARIEGLESLAGAIISAEQLQELAADLAQAVGIRVGPWPA